MRALVLPSLLLLAACGADTPAPGAAHGRRAPVLRHPRRGHDRPRREVQAGRGLPRRALGVPVEYVPTEDYAASVEMFTNGDILLAWFGGLTGVQARHRVPGAHAIAQGVEDPKYFSYFIAHERHGLERSDELPRGGQGPDVHVRLGVLDVRAPHARVLHPRAHRQLAPEAFFAHVGFSGNHDKTVELRRVRPVQVGAVNYKVYDGRVARGQDRPEGVPRDLEDADLRRLQLHGAPRARADSSARASRRSCRRPCSPCGTPHCSPPSSATRLHRRRRTRTSRASGRSPRSSASSTERR